MSETPQYPPPTLSALPDDERAALERELVPFARSAALGELAADIGHDMANPLFAVIGLVDLVLLELPPGSSAGERLGLVRETALQLKQSLRTMLDYVRPPEADKTAALDDAARVATALVRHGRAKELQVAATYPAEPVVVRCPSGALAQAALHLVAAARAIVGDAGSIDVEVTVDGALRIRPAAAGGLGVVAAGRIAADHGGSLDQDGDGLVLRLPLAPAATT
jgi:two-component system, NtrC family, sensor histidine kinase HydH